MSKRNMWLYYGSARKFTENGWFVQVIDAKIASPHVWEGRTIWRFSISKQPDIQIWRDKGPRARLFEKRYFANFEEAKAAAIALAKAS